MTARNSLAAKLLKIANESLENSERDFAIVKIFSTYNIQMKRNHKKDPETSARKEASQRMSLAMGEKVLCAEEILDVLHPFRVQEIKKKYTPRPHRSPRRKCMTAAVVCLAGYKESKSISYGQVGGGPPSKAGSKKICPKCNSMGLHLAVGYKERYYSCVYCGFHKDLETKTLNY
tara:strand:- start:259 stop:783 length:525 start_codon:yes stop_codon:yes gene_type:complete